MHRDTFKHVKVDVKSNLKRLLAQEDLDKDFKITVDDRGPKKFQLMALDGSVYEVLGTYSLSNLLQRLAQAHQEEIEQVVLDYEDLYQPTLFQVRESIQQRYWQALTRNLDNEGIALLLEDTKTLKKDRECKLYVPYLDVYAWNYFSSLSKKHPYLHLDVHRLPKKITPNEQKKLDLQPGLLSLALNPETSKGFPFVIPGGRFNEMYGWDSYFVILGLVASAKVELALSVLENCAYEIEYYGAVLNANRSYYLSRANPPLFTSMIKALIFKKEQQVDFKSWLKRMLLSAIKEYEVIWMSPLRQTPVGLTRYYGGDLGPCIEVEPEHYLNIYQTLSDEKGYSAEDLQGKSATFLKQYFMHDRAMRESGHDTTNRLVSKAANLSTVDLNSLLFKYERDIADLLFEYFPNGLETSTGKRHLFSEWKLKAERRKEKIDRYLWNEVEGCFYDYDHEKNQQTHYESMTNYYPLFAQLCSKRKAKRLMQHAIEKHETPGGLVASTKHSRGVVNDAHPQRQWDYPFGWAPHQILFWKGALNYGAESSVVKLAYKWIYMMTKEAANYAGVIVEKYDVVQRTHKVKAEYGNEGLDFNIAPKEGFAWVNASYELGLQLLPDYLKKHLEKLTPPEWIFKQKK